MLAQPVALNNEEHKNLKITGNFTAESMEGRHVVPLMLQEFTAAAAHYPIFFLQINEKQYNPVGVFGLKEGQNLLLQDGQFVGNYVPAAVRCYPFTLAQANDQELILCLNDKADNVSTTEGQALFNEDGSHTEFFKGINNFFRDYIDANTANRNVMDQITEMGLLRADGLQYRDLAGKEHRVNGFYVIDQEKFNALSDEQFLTLRKFGVLPAIYAHFASLERISNLISRLPV